MLLSTVAQQLTASAMSHLSLGLVCCRSYYSTETCSDFLAAATLRCLSGKLEMSSKIGGSMSEPANELRQPVSIRYRLSQ